LEINNNNYFECSFDSSMALEECTICKADFEQGEKLAGHGNKETQVNKCAGHVFHKDCLQKWLKQKDECPLDKQTINGLPTDMRPTTDMRPNNAQAEPNNAEDTLVLFYRNCIIMACLVMVFSGVCRAHMSAH